jgi:hypothetical protein
MRAALARWYADHAAIRRLWAIDDPLALIVFVALEPTSDGDDTLPLWFAHQSNWRRDLQLLTRRQVQLKLIVPGAFAEPCVSPDAVTVAELSWRDSWESPLPLTR